MSRFFELKSQRTFELRILHITLGTKEMAAAPSLASIFCALVPALDQPVQEYMSGVLDESNATTVDEVFVSMYQSSMFKSH
jgi:hypothetical protein